MSESTFFVSEAAVRNLKQIAAKRVPSISSAHLSEGVAAALGFRTQAALRSALAGRPTVQVQKPKNARLVERLRQFGYGDLPDDLNLLPELDCSYSPFRNDPLRTRRGIRWYAWRNLLVAAINAGLEQRQFGLSPGEDWWPGAEPKGNGGRRGIFRFTLENEMPAIASVDAISGGELSFYVVLNPKHEGVEPEVFSGFRDGDAVARCWLERKLGAWIQDGNTELSCRRPLLPWLAGLAIEPEGYGDLGSFIM